MAKDPKNHRKQWTPQEVQQLQKLADGNTPTRLIAHKLGRTEDAVRTKAGDEDISLKPTNKRLSLSRLNHWLPGCEAYPKVMEGTAEVHHQSADAHLPEAASVFDAATALDTALDMVDPQPTLVERLVRHVLLPRALLPHIAINSSERCPAGRCGVAMASDMLCLDSHHGERTHARRQKPMDKDERLVKILGQLRGGRLEDVADKLLALFRAPAWWEEAFDKQFVARGSRGAVQDTDTCDAVKACIRALLTRAHHEERHKLLGDIERISATYFAGAGSPEETASARQFYTMLLHDLRHQSETPPATPGCL